MASLPESTRLLYAQLLTQCLHGPAPSGRGLSFVSKRIKGTVQRYLQITAGNRKTQHYVGPDSELVRELIAKERALWDASRPDAADRERLVAMLISGGAATVSAVEARVFELLERTGVFVVGGVLVGSHAFALYANMLGVTWASETVRTHDVDIAGESHMAVGVPDRPMNLRQVLTTSALGFIEVPALDRKSPSTRFRIRGRELSVDILTPMRGKPSEAPVQLPSLGVYAEPVRFLDYVMADPQPVVVVARAGILVNVPAPARYALHKLVTAQRRVAAFHTKARKDLDQAEQVIRLLATDRPGDLRLAWEAALDHAPKFREQVRSGLARLSQDARDALDGAVRTRRRKQRASSERQR